MFLLEDLFWLVVLVVVSQIVSRIWSAALRPSSNRTAAPRQPAAGSMQSVHMERDPVCGTYVVPERSISVDDGAGRVYFCSAACRDKYRARTA